MTVVPVDGSGMVSAKLVIPSSICLPGLGPVQHILATRYSWFLGRKAIERCGYLINTSRAAIVDEEALEAALAEGRIRGAALDVFTEEPLPASHRLRSTPRLLTTPHIGYVTRETYEVFFAGMVDAIGAFLEGEPIGVIG